MAEINLPTQTLGRFTTPTFYTDGPPTPMAMRLVDGTLAPADDQFLVANDEKTVLYFKNGATVANVVIERDYACDGTALGPRTEMILANGERIIHDFARTFYGDTLKFAIDDVSNVSVAVLRLP